MFRVRNRVRVRVRDRARVRLWEWWTQGMADLNQSRAVNGTPSHSYRMSLAIWDHSVTCYPTQVNTRVNPCSQTGWKLIYLPRRDGRLS